MIVMFVLKNKRAEEERERERKEKMECWKDQKLLESISKAQNLSKQLQR